MHALCQVGLHSSLGLLFNASHTSCLNAQVGGYNLTFKILEYVPPLRDSAVATYQAYLTGTLLVAATYSGIGINTGNSWSMSHDSSTEHTCSSLKHFAYITLPAPIMEYLEPAALELFHRGNGLVRCPI